jgi:hypothetical protein
MPQNRASSVSQRVAALNLESFGTETAALQISVSAEHNHGISE